MNYIDTLKQALETFERMNHADSIFAGEFDGEITSLRLAIEQAEKQRPVAWGMRSLDGRIYDCIIPEEHDREPGEYTVPLYTAPLRPLTDEEIMAFYQRYGTGRIEGFAAAVRAIERGDEP